MELGLCGCKRYILSLFKTIILLPYSPLAAELLLAVLSACSSEELTDENAETPLPTPEEIQENKNKILAAGKMYMVYQILRCVLLLSCPILLEIAYG